MKQPPINKATARGSVLRMMLNDMRAQPALTAMFPSLVSLFAEAETSDRKRWLVIMERLEEIAT